MPKATASFYFGMDGTTNKMYHADFVTDYEKRVSIVFPPHLSGSVDTTKVNAIATAIGAIALSYQPEDSAKVVITEKNAICPTNAGFTPRKIKFSFSDGHTMAIPVGSGGSGVKTAYTALKSALEANSVTVLCAELQGEEFPNVNDVATVSYTGGATNPAGNGSYYKGFQQYISDYGDTIVLPFKIMANPADALPSVFNGSDSCLGTIVTGALSCPGNNKLVNQRRVIVNYNVETDGGTPEQRELPIAEYGDIKTCFTGMSSAPGIFCMGYKGETRKNIQLL